MQGWAIRILFALMLFLGQPFHAQAQQSRLSNTSGEKLLHICAPNNGPAMYSSDFARNTLDISVCEAYITGIYDTMSQMQQNGSSAIACVPDSVNARPIRGQLIQWLEQHPEDGSKQASAVVLHVLQMAFPCNGKPSLVPNGNVVTKMPGGSMPSNMPSMSTMSPDNLPLHLPPMHTPGDKLPSASGSSHNGASQSPDVPSAPPSDLIPIPDSP